MVSSNNYTMHVSLRVSLILLIVQHTHLVQLMQGFHRFGLSVFQSTVTRLHIILKFKGLFIAIIKSSVNDICLKYSIKIKLILQLFIIFVYSLDIYPVKIHYINFEFKL